MTQEQIEQATTPIQMPRYTLTEITPGQALRDLSYFTNGFQSLKADPKFIVNLHQRILLLRKNVTVGFLPAPPKDLANYLDVIKKVIGPQGYWMKKTTDNCKVLFIWYDPTLNNFLFWAPNKFTIVKAMNAIRYRLTKYADFNFTDTKTTAALINNGGVAVPDYADVDDEGDYAGMPELVSFSE